MSSIEKQRAAIALLSTIPIVIESMDRLQGTNLYRQQVKYLCRRLYEQLEPLHEHFYNTVCDDGAESDFNQLISAVEEFQNAMLNSDADKIHELHAILKEWNAGEVKVIDKKEYEANGL